MEILGKYKNQGIYIVKDANDTYPIFEESLHSKEIFDNLIESGYKFCGLPYDFRKNGVSIETLPVIDFEITPDQEFDMHDLNDLQRYDGTELIQRVSVDDVKYIDELPANYTIATREDFIAYLTDCQTHISEDDFYPINYFVHPNARFTVDEWMSGDYKEYFNVMERRRNLSYLKFLKLRNWLVDIGMNPMGTASDIVDMYTMWGVDGLNARFIAKKRKISYVYDDFRMHDGLAPDAYEITRTEEALVDMYGAVFPPEDIPEGYDGWHVAYTRGRESQAFKNKISRLAQGEYGTVTVTTKSEDEIIEMSTLKETISISPYKIKCGNTSMHMFTVHLPDVTNKILQSYFWSAKYDQRVLDMSRLYALSYDLINRMRRDSDVSSYKLLTELGCDIKGAFRYMLNMQGPTSAFDDESDDVIPTEADINMFVAGGYEEDELPAETVQALDVLKDIKSGKINSGAIADGERLDAHMNVDEVYKYLYCAHFCKTKMSMDYIASRMGENLEKNIEHIHDRDGFERDALPLVSGEFVINVPCNEIKEKIKGYTADANSFKTKQGEQCCGFLKVTQVASEYGTQQPRHVAFEAQTVNLYANGGKANRLLDELMEIFEQQLIENVPLSKQPTLRLYKRVTCMNEYFRVATEGRMKFTNQMGGKSISFPFEKALEYASTIQTKITSTAVYCAMMVDDSGMLTHYCVNADITPWKIYPRTGTKLPCASLPSLWYDWNQMGQPKIAEELTVNGYTYVGFVPWTRRYFEQRYFKNLDNLPAVADLVNYMRYCEDFRAATKTTEEFEHAPHMESLFYGIYPDETVRQDNGVELRADGTAPSVRVSIGSYVEPDPSHGKVNIKKIEEPALQRFRGFTAEDFAMLGDVTKVKMPGFAEKYISVDGDTISTEDRDNLPVYMISQLNSSYPVVNIYGRKYLFRDIYGDIWEARV